MKPRIWWSPAWRMWACGRTKDDPQYRIGQTPVVAFMNWWRCAGYTR